VGPDKSGDIIGITEADGRTIFSYALKTSGWLNCFTLSHFANAGNRFFWLKPEKQQAPVGACFIR
jgi:hypothetical protein